MKCAFYTLGCKVNQYESGAMAQELERYGIECVDFHEDADIYVINSCTVTAESDRKTRQAVRRFRSNHPDSIIVLAGCMVQADSQAARNLPEADIVLGNKNTDKLYGLILQFINSGSRVVSVEPHQTGDKFRGNTVSSYADKTRAIVKIEDGCNRFCSYCIIPYARGRVRSKPIEEIKEEVSGLSSNGYKELVLVGINLSAYGSDSGSDIVEAVRTAASVDGVRRVRLGSLEPDHITNEVLQGLSEIPEFCPQFHISLQSGCDKTLKKMNRHYDTVEYEDLCLKIREMWEDASITTDIMVGFPGESESDFNISLDFVKKIGFEKVHVFPYSRRPGTPAASMENQVGNSVKQHRSEIMADECEKIRTAALKGKIGRTVEIIPEENHNGVIRGYTADYTPVAVNFKAPFGEIVRVRITGVENGVCIAEAAE